MPYSALELRRQKRNRLMLALGSFVFTILLVCIWAWPTGVHLKIIDHLLFAVCVGLALATSLLLTSRAHMVGESLGRSPASGVLLDGWNVLRGGIEATAARASHTVRKRIGKRSGVEPPDRRIA